MKIELAERYSVEQIKESRECIESCEGMEMWERRG